MLLATGDLLTLEKTREKGREKIISLYENGELGAEAAVVQLKTHVLFNQVSFHTDKALSQLHFVEAIVVEG